MAFSPLPIPLHLSRSTHSEVQPFLPHFDLERIQSARAFHHSLILETTSSHRHSRKVFGRLTLPLHLIKYLPRKTTYPSQNYFPGTLSTKSSSQHITSGAQHVLLSQVQDLIHPNALLLIRSSVLFVEARPATPATKQRNVRNLPIPLYLP